MALSRPYEYTPLPHQNCIRVLELFAGSQADPIICGIHVLDYTADACDKHDYEAVSYVWGSPELVAKAICDGKELLITHNLADALRAFRRPESSRLLWVDAVCINQRDVEEKGVQVAQMKRVYERASQVLVWLGAMDEAAQSAMELFLKLEEVRKQGISHPEKDVMGFNLANMNEDFVALREELSLKVDDMRWKGVGSVLSKPYFSRVWVLQEACSNTALAFIGEEQVPFTGITYLAQCLCYNLQKENLAESCGWSNKGFYHASVMHSRCDGLKEDLLGMLQLARECHCTDPRDRLHGLRGLLSLPTVSGEFTASIVSLAPDYSETVDALYLKIAIYSIQTTKSLEVLRYVFHSSQESLKLRSWVPRWDVQAVVPRFGSTEWTSNGGLLLTSILTDVTDYITVKGIAFDVVQEVHRFQNNSDWVKPPLGIADSWSDLFSEDDHRYVTGESLVRAFALAVVASFFSWGDSKGNATEKAAEHLYSWLFHSKILTSEDWDKLAGDHPAMDTGNWNIYEGAAMSAGFFVHHCIATARGYLGLGPPLVQPGDVCCILWGGQVPFILRAVDEHWILIGEAYVHGVMEGQVLDFMEEEMLEERSFEIW